MSKRLMACLIALLLLVAACSEEDSAPATAAPTTEATMADDMGDTMADDMGDTMADDMGDMDADHTEEFAFGDPMEASDADRVIEITAKDDLTFEPSSITVASGETVTFRVTNAGVLPHDFALGDSEAQDEHEAEMAEMGPGMEHNEPNALSLEPGETKETTWHFTEAGEILFGCHQPGHYAAGMKGTLSIEG